jgi:hypothetical protein
MLAISHQSVDGSSGDSAVRALLIRTGEARSVDPLGCSSATFHLTPGSYRSRRSFYSRRGRGDETTDRAIKRGAWFEGAVDQGVCGLHCQVREALMNPVKVPKPCQAKDKAKREQKREGRNYPPLLVAIPSHPGPCAEAGDSAMNMLLHLLLPARAFGG